jgi:hypothetical protein
VKIRVLHRCAVTALPFHRGHRTCARGRQMRQDELQTPPPPSLSLTPFLFPSSPSECFTFLYHRCHRAHSTAAPALCTTGAATKGLNGSALAPRCSPPNLITGVTAGRLLFSFSPSVVNNAATTSPFDSSPSGEPLAPFFHEELP